MFARNTRSDSLSAQNGIPEVELSNGVKMPVLGLGRL